MGSIWDDFMEEYEDYLHLRCIATLLQAFYYYSKNDIVTCREIMNIPDKEV